jgi:hypothetical protein
MDGDRSDGASAGAPQPTADDRQEKGQQLEIVPPAPSTVRPAKPHCGKEEAMDGTIIRAARVWSTAACALVGAIAERAPAGTESLPGPATDTHAPRALAWQEQVSLRPPDGVSWRMGSAVALDQGVLAVGPARDWDLGRDLGSVRIFLRDGAAWHESGEIVHPSGDTQAHFGGALALQAGTLVVGAPCDGARGFQSGAAFVYQRRGTRWLMQASLHRPRAMSSDLTGSAVAIDARTLVIGVPKADEGALDTGAVEVYELRDDMWVHATTLTAPTPQVGAFFGMSVAVDGSTIFVGSPGDDSDGPIAGKVHVYRRNGKAWSWDASIGCPTGPRGWFGASVTAADGIAVVGAPRAARPGSADARIRGAAWTLQRRNNRWTCDACLIPDRAEEGDSIGCSAATDGRTILLGATADSLRGDMTGCAFAFTRPVSRGSWRAQRLDPETAGISALIGHGLAVDGSWVALGRLGDPEADPAPGEVVLFQQAAVREIPPPRTESTNRSASP